MSIPHIFRYLKLLSMVLLIKIIKKDFAALQGILASLNWALNNGWRFPSLRERDKAY